MHLQMDAFLLFLPDFFEYKFFKVFTNDLYCIGICCHSSLFSFHFASLSFIFLFLLVGLGVCQFCSPLQRANSGMCIVLLVSLSLLSALVLVICCHRLHLDLASPSSVYLFAITLLMWAFTAANFPLRTNTAFYDPLKSVQICFMLAVLFWKLCHKNLERMQLLDVMFGKYPAELLG